ncbi:lipid-A-disaccharide synthase [Solemya elarraichensis gill symbiont]|uniref:Lipid-A-disaccharide synthase n=1 Tax=Solemya elarraichensis gill symbiont TaxID=1918949 RepID=A0A1T2LCY5_9GAMM|nr:lipid-A-disaccharide synthase [Solemya elarraichensis gill symbiont]OOZ42968.1 lipid-A-disaccharide synthase [Solemya elarraichensis gill symbiont]
MPLTIAVVAAEPSGDLLGAALMVALKSRHADISFIGVGGPEMAAAGLHSRIPLEKLSVMGIFEVLPRLPELLKLRRNLRDWLIAQKPDIFIGIDAPDFNLGLARALKSEGIRTIQYVSPTVWAWKQKRVTKIRASVDMVLCLFPFEESFLHEHDVAATYVGHPMADQLPMEPDRRAARERLGLPEHARILALLPGSRSGEVERIAGPFLQTAVEVSDQLEGLHVVVPLVNKITRSLFEEKAAPFQTHLKLILVDRHAADVMAAADVVLLASGTATLQGLLSKRPMVVGYRLNVLTYALIRLFRMIKIPYVAIANLLCGEMLAPEFIQKRCRAELMTPAVLQMFGNDEHTSGIEQRYAEIHLQLRRDAAASAAEAVLDQLGYADSHV